MENIELRNIDDELQHTFNSMSPYFLFTEIIGDWKYEHPQMGTCIGTNLKTGSSFFCEYNPPIDFLTLANMDNEGNV